MIKTRLENCTLTAATLTIEDYGTQTEYQITYNEALDLAEDLNLWLLETEKIKNREKTPCHKTR